MEVVVKHPPIGVLLIALTAPVLAQTPNDPADRHINVRFEDIGWLKIIPDLGDNSPEIGILHVEPKTQATKLMIRVPKNFHVKRH
jgi:hypothetical protein